jgi:hypothetical protein
MTVVRSNLTSKQILEGTIDYAVPLYLREGETKEGLLGKFGGDTVKLIQFLREREFEQYKSSKKLEPKKQPQEKPKPEEKSEKPSKKKEVKPVEKKTEKPKSKKQPPASNQKGLF